MSENPVGNFLSNLLLLILASMVRIYLVQTQLNGGEFSNKLVWGEGGNLTLGLYNLTASH